MTRIEPVRRENANESTVQILDAVKTKMGMVPNLVATMAQSDAVANAYLGFSGALSKGVLPARIREQISLAVGESNRCGYCVSAHSLLGKSAGLNDSEIEDARRGQATDSKEAAAIAFANAMVNERGHVSDQQVQSLRDAGFNEAEIVEVIANVSLNIFTNYFNHVAGTEIDFPVAPELAEVS